MKVVAVGAHPDDVEISMFGILCAWKQRGASISIAVATNGEKGGIDPSDLPTQRIKEASMAANLINVKPHFFDFKDGELINNEELIYALGQYFENEKPDIIITHASNDYHSDHRTLSGAVRAAASFKSPVIYADNFYGVDFHPTYYIDVSNYFSCKCKAIRMHVSQQPERFVTMVKTLNKLRANQCNNPEGYVECYKLEPAYPFVDIRNLLPPSPPINAVFDRNEVSGS